MAQGYYPQVFLLLIHTICTDLCALYAIVFVAAPADISTRWSLSRSSPRSSPRVSSTATTWPPDDLCVSCTCYSITQFNKYHLFRQQQPEKGGGAASTGCMACLAGICLCCCAEGPHLLIRIWRSILITYFLYRTLRVLVLKLYGFFR